MNVKNKIRVMLITRILIAIMLVLLDLTWLALLYMFFLLLYDTITQWKSLEKEAKE